MSHEQLLLELLGDEAKKPAAADPEDKGPAADPLVPKEPETRARRVSKLNESLKSLPAVVREIIHPDVLAAPADFRLLSESRVEWRAIVRKLSRFKKCFFDCSHPSRVGIGGHSVFLSTDGRGNG